MGTRVKEREAGVEYFAWLISNRESSFLCYSRKSSRETFDGVDDSKSWWKGETQGQERTNDESF